MGRSRIAAIAFAVGLHVFGVVSCGGSTNDSSGSGGQAGADAGADVAVEAGDGGVDATVDAAPDVTQDVSADIESDVAADVAADVAQDVTADVVADVGQDVVVDVVPDAGFTPAAIKDLVIWLSADTGLTTSSSGAVSFWTDQSGKANHASQSSPAAQPVVLASALNGLPVVHFDGVSSHFSLPAGLSDFTAGLSAFVLVRPAANTKVHAARFFDFSSSYGSLTNAVVFVRFDTPGDQLFYQAYSGATPGPAVTAPGAVVNGLWQTHEVVAVGGTPLSTAAASLYKNGVNVGGGTVVVPAQVTRSSNLIARSNLGQDPYFKGDIGEIIVFARALSDAERKQVEAYLKTKWAL